MDGATLNYIQPDYWTFSRADEFSFGYGDDRVVEVIFPFAAWAVHDGDPLPGSLRCCFDGTRHYGTQQRRSRKNDLHRAQAHQTAEYVP